jgi:hypothetical protein
MSKPVISKHLRPGPGGPEAGVPGQPYTNPYVNPNDVVTKHFFDPITPNDQAFSAMQPSYEVSTASPIGQIMSDFKEAQAQMKNNGGK